MTVTRGASNGNSRGSSEQRRKRRAWLLEAYAADRKMVKVEWGPSAFAPGGHTTIETYVISPGQILDFAQALSAEEFPTCRCYRCGELLHEGTMTIDRIIPGCLGGTYASNNIRPACYRCNTETGAAMANLRDLEVSKARVRMLSKFCSYCLASKGSPCVSSEGKRLSTFHAPRRSFA